MLVPGTAGIGKKKILQKFGAWVEGYFTQPQSPGKNNAANHKESRTAMRPFQVFVEEPELGGVRNLLDSTLNLEARCARIRTALLAVREAIERRLREADDGQYLVYFIPVHLVGYRHGEFTLLYTPDEFDECLGPVDMLVTLIDHIYDLWARMVESEVKKPQHTYVSLRETSQWRSMETMVADFHANHFSAWKRTWIRKKTKILRKDYTWLPDYITEWWGTDPWNREPRGDLLAPWEVRNYVLAVNHPTVTLFRLVQRAIIAKFAIENKEPHARNPIRDEDRTPGPIYASYPISEPRKFLDEDGKKPVRIVEARKDRIMKIQEYRKLLHEKLIVFDPVTIDDRILFFDNKQRKELLKKLGSGFKEFIAGCPPIEATEYFGKLYGDANAVRGNILWYGPSWDHRLCEHDLTMTCGLCPLQKEAAWNRVNYPVGNNGVRLEFVMLPDKEVQSLSPSFYFEPEWVNDQITSAADIAPVRYDPEAGIFWRVTRSGYVDNLIALRDYRLIEQSDGLIALTRVKVTKKKDKKRGIDKKVKREDDFSGGVRREIAYAFGIGRGWVCAVYRTFWDAKSNRQKLRDALKVALKDVGPFDDEVLIVDSPETAIKVMFRETSESLVDPKLFNPIQIRI